MTDAEQDQAVCATRADVTVGDLYRRGGGRVPSAIRAMCAACPVRTPCVEDALRHEGDASRHLRFGIWGGTTPAERHAIAAGRRVPQEVAG